MKLTCKILIVALAAMSPLTAWGSAADILERLPDDAAMVVVTQPIEQLDARIAAVVGQMAASIGMAAGPDGSSPLDFSIQQTLAEQLTLPAEMVDPTGSLGLAIGDLDDAGGTAMLMLPVTDVAEAMTMLREESQAETVAEDMIAMTFTDAEFFVGKDAKHLIFAATPEQISASKAARTGVTLNAGEKAILKESLAIAKLDLKPLMQQAMDGFETAMSAAMAAGGPGGSSPKMMEASMMQVKLLAEMCKDLDTGVVGVDLNDAGLVIKQFVTPVKGSELSKALSGHTKAGISQFNALPNKPYVLAYSFNANSAAFESAMDKMFDAFNVDESGKVRFTPAEIAEFKGSFLKSSKLMKGGVFGMFLPAMNQPGMNMLGVMNTTDSDKMMAAYRETYPLINKFMSASMDMQSTYTAKAGTSGGVSYDEWVFDLTAALPPDAPAEARQQLAQMYGPDMKLKTKMFPLDDKNLAMTMGTADMAELISFHKSKGAGLAGDAGIASAMQNLPDQANFYGFMSLSNMMRWTMMQSGQQNPQAMMMMGPLMNIQGAIGGCAILEPQGVRADVSIPSDVIQGVGSVVAPMIVMMQMSGGGGMPGGPGTMGPQPMPAQP